ncbi:MAG: cbb3-type cytochrome c oxidase subunit 3 [Magnetococcales bacterium]|nr:cbb3-type cytochrome c oxidase subunit 3 [Magnetococcales bacterium]
MDFQEWYTWSQSVTLVWFFVLFVGIVVWVYWPSRQKKYDEAARKILEEDAFEK